VVGVNTAIFSPSGGSIGIGFAIPSSMAKNIIDQLRDHGQIKRGWLGVRIQTVTPEIADSLGLGKPRGALVSGVTADGPAAKAGLQQGDVVVNFDGKDVPEMRRLPLMVAESDVGKTVDVTVFRKGQELTVKIKLGELKLADDDDKAKDEDSDNAQAADPSTKVKELGLQVSALNDALRTRYNVKKGATGVVVTGVAVNGPAADQGIQQGDVIAEASRQEVKTPKDLADRVKVAQKDGKPLLLLVNRGDDMRFVAITLDKKK